MKIIAEDAERITMLDYFEGRPVHFYMDKATREIYVDAGDVALCLGYKDQDEMLGSDAGLDALLDYQKSNPDKPFLRTSDDFKTENTMQVNKDSITAGQLLKALQALPTEALEQPLQILFTATDKTGLECVHSPEVRAAYSYSEDVLITADGLALLSEYKELLAEDPDYLHDSEKHVYFTKNKVILHAQYLCDIDKPEPYNLPEGSIIKS